MSDYFDRIEEHLLHAVERSSQRHPQPAGGLAGRLSALRRRIGRRPGLLALAGALILSGSATGAVLLGVQHSRPLSGIVPPYHSKADTLSVAGARYEITLMPSLAAGSIGWCETIWYRHMRGSYGSGGCGSDAPALGRPVLASDGESGEGLKYVLTAPQVAAVRVAKGPTVLTRGGQGLPFGFRAAVFQVGRNDTPHNAPLKVTPLDAEGRTIASVTPGQGTPREQTRYWSSSQKPVKGACSLSAKPGSGVKVTEGAVVTRPLPAPGIVGRAFLSCEAARLSMPNADGLPFAALLLDARHPGNRPAALPYTQPVSGHPGVYASRLGPHYFSGSFVARRVGDAWLLVTRLGRESEAIDAIDALSVGPLRLSPPRGDPPAQRNALCGIEMRPLSGAQEVSQTAFLLRGAAAASRGPRRLPVPAERLSPCAKAEFYLHRWPLTATVMYATGHRRAPRRLARAHAIPRNPGTFAIVSSSGQWRRTAKRIGRAWLEIEGGEGPSQQRLLLSRLRITVARSGKVHFRVLPSPMFELP